MQTYNPDSFAIKTAANNDYLAFYNEEIKIRELMDYPPFNNLLLINFSCKNEDELIKYSQNIGVILKNKLKEYKEITMLGPCPCTISKIKEMYRWQIILKGKVDIKLAENIKKDIYVILKSAYNEIRVSMDMNPNSLL